MKLLITGASGLVGSAISNLYQQKGVAINYLTTQRHKIISRPGFQGFFWDPMKKEMDVTCLEGVSGIINLAGNPISRRWTSHYKQKVRSSRIDSLKTLYRAMEKYGTAQIESLVTASAIGIYPSAPDTLYTEEAQDINSGFLGDIVTAWEYEADRFQNLGLGVAKIRIGLVLSTHGGALPQMAQPIKKYLGAAFGSGKQWQSWIHIDDLARIFSFVIDNKLQGTYNAVAPQPVTNTELTQGIARQLGRPLWLPNIPKFAMRMLLGEMTDLLFESQKVSSQKIARLGFEFKHRVLSDALKDLYGKHP